MTQDAPRSTLHASRFLAACRREPTDCTPIWLMRQAGRYMPEYRAIKEKFPSILDMVKRPDIAAEITMQPLRAFAIDAAIIFADILTLLEPMGIKLEFVKGEGPVIHNPVRDRAAIDALADVTPESSMAFTLDAIRLVKKELAGKLPLIGFSGAPFTLSCYAIEGGATRDYLRTKTLMYQSPEDWHALMDKLAVSVGHYLAAQAEAGADALQLFDSWVGALSPEDYRRFVLPHTQKCIRIAQEKHRVPLIHFGTGTSAMLPLIRDAGGDVIGVDWRIDLSEAWQHIGGQRGIQGNMDPTVLFAPIDEIERQARRILESVRGKPGHIFNLGHGVLQYTPVDNVKRLVDFVHEYSRIGGR
ncbi:MAG: uroporphyrinogen decarboxylase [bacterium]